MCIKSTTHHCAIKDGKTFWWNSTSKNCQECEVEGCIDCGTEGRCTKCMEGYFPTQLGHVCKEHIENCANEDYVMNANFDMGCSECDPGYFVTEEGNCAACQDSPFLEGCSECSDAFTCTSCVHNQIKPEN